MKFVQFGDWGTFNIEEIQYIQRCIPYKSKSTSELTKELVKSFGLDDCDACKHRVYVYFKGSSKPFVYASRDEKQVRLFFNSLNACLAREGWVAPRDQEFEDCLEAQENPQTDNV